jgi:hypothetical protein
MVDLIDTSQDSGIGYVVLLWMDTPLLEEVCLVLNWEMYINPTGEPLWLYFRDKVLVLP